MDRIETFLTEHPFFRDLARQEIAAITRAAATRTLARGEVLALEGEPYTTVYLILEGRVRALKTSPQGREQVVREMRPPEALYLVPALDGGPLPATIRAATRATLVAFPRAAVERLLAEHPSVARHVLRDLAGRLRRCTSLIEDLSLRTVPERLARLLIERAQEPTDARRITQQEMAFQLGTVREVVARALSQFEAQGWIRVERGVIEILDLGALRALTDPDAA